MDLIGALVLVSDSQLLQLGDDVVGCTTIGVPVGVNAIVHLCCSSGLGVGLVILLEAVPADVGLMALLLAHLIDRFSHRLSTSLGRRWRVVGATSTIAAAEATTAMAARTSTST